MPGFLNFYFIIASLRQNLSDVFSCSCLLECCLTTISGHDLCFVCLFILCFCFVFVFFWLPLFLNRSACDKFNADGFTFNHAKQKKISVIGVCWAPLA